MQMNKTLSNKLKNIMDKAVSNKEIAGANLLVRVKGEELAYCEAGYADVSNNIPVRRDTIFRLYSMTKPITATAIMMLMERGLIDLADPVSDYLPGFKDQKVYTNEGYIPVRRQITISDLLSMTSGMPYGHNLSQAGRETQQVFDEIDKKLRSEKALSTVEIANRLGQCSLEFHPGDGFMYGTSADILGAIVEVVSGISFGDFLRNEIFEPLGMNDTDFFVPEEKIHRFSKVFQGTDSGIMEWETNHLGIIHTIKPAFESGGAGLASTIDDYEKFATMLLNKGSYNNKKLLSSRTVDYFISGELTPWQQESFWRTWDRLYGYSYGNLMRILKHPGMAVLHGSIGEYGWDGWLGTCFCNAPQEELSIIFMIQKKDAGMTPVFRKLKNVIFSELEI